ncbi:MAG: penicillin-binding transpeptidase domain-containing protein, partial [Planctomycetota bacterium]
RSRYSGSYLLEELPGVLPPFGPADDVTESKAAYMAIGEGAMTASPLQVAAAHATLARGGLYISPTFVQPRSRPADNPQTVYPLHLSPAACDRALRGMERSANFAHPDGAERGTTVQIGYADGSSEPVFNTPGVTVFAKSGTAQPPPLLARDADDKIVRDEEGKAVVARTGNHAWVVALVRPDGEPRPTHAIACVVEYGGSGGRTAGPIVNQIIRALATEGYLGGLALQAVQPSPVGSENPS